MKALFNDKAAANDPLSDVVSKACHRTIRFPGYLREQVQGMTADGENEQFLNLLGRYPSIALTQCFDHLGCKAGTVGDGLGVVEGLG